MQIGRIEIAAVTASFDQSLRVENVGLVRTMANLFPLANKLQLPNFRLEWDGDTWTRLF